MEGRRRCHPQRLPRNEHGLYAADGARTERFRDLAATGFCRRRGDGQPQQQRPKEETGSGDDDDDDDESLGTPKNQFKKKDSLLDDYEETPMEKRLRRVQYAS